MALSYNKGEWSELYAFIKLLKEGKVYAADANAARIDDVYLPIIKMIREEKEGERKDYYTGDTIRIFKTTSLYTKFLRQISIVMSARCSTVFSLPMPEQALSPYRPQRRSWSF